jgi:hypothetical protein
MTRTTLDLDSSVLAQLRRTARAERKSMGQLASERLAIALAGEPSVPQAIPELPLLRLGTPAVDLYDKDALWRLLDAQGDAHAIESRAQR